MTMPQDQLRAAMMAGDDACQTWERLVAEQDAEIARLHLELQRHQVSGDYAMGQLHAEAALFARYDDLVAENERLRAALCAHHSHVFQDYGDDICRGCGYDGIDVLPGYPPARSSYAFGSR